MADPSSCSHSSLLAESSLLGSIISSCKGWLMVGLLARHSPLPLCQWCDEDGHVNQFNAMRCEEKPAGGVLEESFLPDKMIEGSSWSPFLLSFLSISPSLSSHLGHHHVRTCLLELWHPSCTVKGGIANTWIRAECREQTLGLEWHHEATAEILGPCTEGKRTINFFIV